MGEHQIQNASIAIKAALLLKQKYNSITFETIRKGLFDARWPARYDVRSFNKKNVIVDGSHNISGIKSLTKTYLSSPFGRRKAAVIFSVMRDKDYKAIIKALSGITAEVYIYELKSARALESSLIANEFKKFLSKDKIKMTGSLIGTLRKKTEKTFLITGSLYLAGEALKIMGGVGGEK